MDREQDPRDTFPAPLSDQVLQDDAVLLQDLAHGDEAALYLLHCQYAGRLLTLALREGLSDPEQAVEDAFILMYRSAGCFTRSELKPSTWIIGLALWHFRRMRPNSQ
jgi:DNA-directed RNA polymerase specialized sigma24 family protein